MRVSRGGFRLRVLPLDGFTGVAGHVVRPRRREPQPATLTAVRRSNAHTAPRVVQHLGRTRLGVLVLGRIVSPLQRELYRRSGGRLSLTGRAPVLLLTTTGRRTGKPRTVPLLYLRDGDRLVTSTPASNSRTRGPEPAADPHAGVQIGRSTTTATARPASADELAACWPQLTAIWPAYQAFCDNSGERSVFVLEPDGPP